MTRPGVPTTMYWRLLSVYLQDPRTRAEIAARFGLTERKVLSTLRAFRDAGYPCQTRRIGGAWRYVVKGEK